MDRSRPKHLLEDSRPGSFFASPRLSLIQLQRHPLLPSPRNSSTGLDQMQTPAELP